MSEARPARMRVTGLLLAAGTGTRFRAAGGGNKLLAPLPDTGVPVVVQAARALRAGCDDLLAAVPAADAGLAQLLQQEGARTVGVAAPQRGMGHSLATLAAAVPDGTAVLVLLGDMPFVQAATVRAVADAVRAGASIALPVHDGAIGHPVGFAAQHLPALRALDGDRGASALVKAHALDVIRVRVADPGIAADVDLPQALRGVSSPAR